MVHHRTGGGPLRSLRDLVARGQAAQAAANEIIEASMTEEQLQASVLDLAKALGMLAYHTHDSRRSAAGFPDLVLAGTRGVIFAELKSAGGTMRPEQTNWKYMLIAGGQRWRLYRPGDWATGVIQSDLKEIA